MLKKLIYLLLISVILLVSCEKDNPEPVYEVTPAMARDTLYYIMNQWYYWYDLMPSVTKENYKDPYELLEAMRYKKLDKWSIVYDYDDFIAESLGIFVGHGFRIGVDNSSKARIALIFNNSTLFASGVRRGWIVKKINNVDVAPLLLAGGTGYSNLIGPSTAGVTNTFLFERPDGTELTVTSTKTTFTLNTVLLYDTLHLSSGITGHLVFEEFISPSEDELKTAFAFFKANDVKDIILDLRYNLGGLLTVSQSLASYIGGNGLAGKTYVKLQHNNKNQSSNSTFPFKTTSYSISLPRLIVITSYFTASASELIINGLKPFINVVTVGDTTRGKPMGMYAWYCAKKYAFVPVTFKTVNASNEGEYYDGFPPSRLATDDITHDFDDRNEACLKEAISCLQEKEQMISNVLLNSLKSEH
jgi:C-terminal processing protease CtpA/Prc